MAFSDVNDLEDYLHRPLTVDENSMGVLACNSAKQVIKAFCGQDLEQVAGEVIVLDGNGRDVMVLPDFPVTDVSNVVIEDNTTFDGTDSDQLRFVEAGLIYRVDGGLFTSGIQNITVTYDHGYDDTDEAWDAINIVALSIAGRLFEQGGVSGENIGGYSVTYDYTGPDLTEGEKQVLGPYRSKDRT